MIDFTDQAVIVTGAGRGLGRHYALEFARRHASVVVNDLGCSVDGVGGDPSVSDLVVEEIRSTGGKGVASHDSVRTQEGGAAIVQTTLENFGRVDAVVSNAGIVEMMPFEDIPSENWQRMINTHLDGSFYVSQPAYKVMKGQGYGRLVFIASSAGAFGMPCGTHYAAAKAGILGLTNNIALEFSSR
jgi:NAD(P)-dependent dehydrogenase (short-subunit alcohol dehydrogenase family)